LKIRNKFLPRCSLPLRDRWIGKVSPRRAPECELGRMHALYRERYCDFTVKHFHEQLVKRDNYKLCYTVTKLSLQAAGLVARAKRRSANRKKRLRRPLPGMLLFQDGSIWIAALGRDLDIIVTLGAPATTPYWIRRSAGSCAAVCLDCVSVVLLMFVS
jgi:hypothetical protein